jgi:predicted GIY-YIG superfamily endonuclease
MPAMGAGASVYAIFDRQTDHTYVGSTTQDPKERLRQHAHCINHPDQYSAPAYQHFSSHSQDIRFAVLEHHDEPLQDLAARESQHVASVPSPLRLNANRGGTGGVSFAAAQRAAVAKYGEPLGLPSFETTPEKTYPFTRTDDGRVACQLTPGAKEQSGVVYSIEGPNGLYAGFSTRTAAERASEHAGAASRAPTNPKLANHPLYSQLSAEPESHVLRIHASSLRYPSDLTEIEARIIQHKEEKGSTLFNQNKGRGGCFGRQ